MRYVHVARRIEDGRPRGYELDPDPYLEALPALAEALPPGAKSFALDEDHYNFFGPRCVKDLKLVEWSEADFNGLLLVFEPNQWKHEVGLRIAYRGVVRYVFDPSEEPSGGKTVLLDELLPDPEGVVHEIALTGQTLRVVAQDLDATWA